MTGRQNLRRRWRSEQERQATGMGCEGIRGRMGARAGGKSYPHIHRLVHPRPEGEQAAHHQELRTLPPLPPPDIDEERRVDNQRNTPHTTPLTVQLTVATSEPGGHFYTIRCIIVMSSLVWGERYQCPC